MYSRVKGPNKVGHEYMPLYHGRKAQARDEKSRFDVSEDEEFRLFNLADEHDMCPLNGSFDHDEGHDYCWMNDDHCGLFSVRKDEAGQKLLRIGEHDERFAFFPAVVNFADAWHGYPVTASNVRHPMGEKLMKHLEKIGMLSRIDVVRIKRKAL